MSKVVVTEKPSVARDLARVLGLKTRRDHWIEGGDWRITWALGHLAELKTPDEYDPALKRWTLERLPIVPERFELKPRGDASARAQLQAVIELCRDADELICATDAGREGELIFRYVLEIAGVPERSFRRLWLSSMTDEAIKTAFRQLRDRADFEDLFHAARCRSEADWLVGLNATRYHTVRYRQGGVLWSVGRVQTPVLALIAERDDEIRTFVPEKFQELRTTYREARFTHTGDRFQDEEKANAALAQVTGQPFVITSVEGKREKSPPPWLHDLTSLQRQMNTLYGMSAADTLKVAQELYEKKLLTYPRTDSRHLTRDMVGQVRQTLDQLQGAFPEYVGKVPAGPLPVTRRVFDDAKVSDHHAIVPTGKTPSGLDERAERVFRAVLIRLCQVFLPDRERDITTVLGKSAGLEFRARGVVVVEPGWTAIDLLPPKKAAAKRAPAKKGADADDEQQLPAFEVGEEGPHAPELHKGETKAPRAWTESTLLGAMETAGRFVDDEELREALKARGLGTPATRASILETLVSRGYVVRDKKALRITDLGRALIAFVADPQLKSPELTGEWEGRLKEVEAGRLDPAAFMAEIVDYVRKLVRRDGDEDPFAEPADDGLGPCPRCGAPVIEGRTGFGCSKWAEGCDFVLWKQYRGATLRAGEARALLGRGVVPAPVRLDEVGPRLLCLTRRGIVIDLEVPSRDRQNGPSRPSRSGRPERRAASRSGARKAGREPASREKRPPRAARAPSRPDDLGACPRCKAPLVEGQRGYGCSAWQSGCRFVVWKEIDGQKISAAAVRALVEKGKTRLMKGFRAPGGGTVAGRLVLDAEQQVQVEREAGAG